MSHVSLHSTAAIAVSSCLVAAAMGCMPKAQAPTVSGPIDTKTASALQASVRAKYGPIYSIDHEVNGKTFQANWELGNALKKSAQLQIKPPGDWTEDELYQALEVVLAAHESKPWYGNADNTILKLMRSSMQNEDGSSERGYVDDTPYEFTAKVRHNTNDWFLQIKSQILDKDGNAIGF